MARAGTLLCVAALPLLLALGGCSWGTVDEAEAAPARRIETYRISPDTFVLLTDDDPSVDVSGDTTTYTLRSAADLRFNPVGETETTFALENNDVVIERPASGYVTLIRVQ